MKKELTKDYCLIDIHTHIIPNIDDGSKSIEEANYLLEKSNELDLICLTPHFYPNKDNPNDFIKRRNEKYEEIKTKKTVLGSEVAFFYGISNYKELNELCLCESKYILIEMPYGKWDNVIIEEIEKIIIKGFIPIIAHFERFIKDNKLNIFKSLKHQGAYLQANANFFLRRKRKAMKLFNSGLIDFIGSDCHNRLTRPQNIMDAYEIIFKKGKDEYIKELSINNKKIVDTIKKECI